VGERGGKENGQVGGGSQQFIIDKRWAKNQIGKMAGIACDIWRRGGSILHSTRNMVSQNHTE
jgi:hypothetical protein